MCTQLQNDFQQQLWKSSRVGHVALMLLACLFALFVFIRQYHQCGLCPRALIMLGTNVLPSMMACCWLFLGPEQKVSKWATNVDVFVVFVMAMGVEALTLVCEERVNGLCSVFVNHFIPPLEVRGGALLALQRSSHHKCGGGDVCVYGVRAGDHVRQVVVPILLPHLYVNALQAGWVFVLVYGGLLSVFALLVWNLAVSVNYGMKLSACSFLCVNVAVAVRAPTRWGGSAEGSPPSYLTRACTLQVCAAVASERRLRTQYVLLCSVRGELAAKEAAFREREQLLKEKNLLRDANIRAETSRKVHERTIGCVSATTVWCDAGRGCNSCGLGVLLLPGIAVTSSSTPSTPSRAALTVSSTASQLRPPL